MSYVVLGISFVFEGVSRWVALREFRATKGSQGYFEAFRRSKDPTTFTVLLEDSAALLGTAFAAIGTAAAQWLDMPVLDGVASLCIAGVTAATAFLLARETKGLLVGEPAHPHVAQRIMAVANTDADLRSANGVTTMQMGPDGRGDAERRIRRRPHHPADRGVHHPYRTRGQTGVPGAGGAVRQATDPGGLPGAARGTG